MAWTTYQMFLAGLLIATGSINTLATKWADRTSTTGTQKYENGTLVDHDFNHPFLQATGMFFGEFTCLLFFKLLWFIHRKKETPESELPEMLKGSQDFNPMIFFWPAMCDMFGTSVMYIGLNLTNASSFQMFRGAVIIFTGLFSMFFLKRRINAIRWGGIILVLLGLIVVGCADMFFAKNTGDAEHSNMDILIGDLLIVAAQVIAATQMVLEEKFVSGSNVPPLQAVGWEGLFGMSVLGVLLIPMYFIKINGNRIEDSLDAVAQIGNNWEIAVGFCGTLLSISFFNFAGVSVTKELNATTRMVLDSVRTIIIWGFSLALLWQKFIPLTLLGFFFLIIGMMVYNNILIVPFLVKKGILPDLEPSQEEEDKREIANEDA